MTAIFVALEGLDNAGKTSLLDAILDEFKATTKVTITRELTTVIGPYIRSALNRDCLASLDKVLLFAADRQLRLSGGLSADLQGGGICVADRWTMSAEAYRSVEDSGLASYVEQVNSLFPSPTLTILIDIPAETSFSRGAPIGKNNYPVEYLAKVRDAYLRLAPRHKAHVIDGTVGLTQLKSSVLSEIKKHIELAGTQVRADA